MSERLRQGLQLRNEREIGVGPLKGKDQVERLELSQTCGPVRATVSAPAAPWRLENRQAEGEA